MISKQPATIRNVARRFSKEIGLSIPMAFRMSRKLNDLASHVDWATPLPDGRPTVYRLTSRRRAKRKKK